MANKTCTTMIGHMTRLSVSKSILRHSRHFSLEVPSNNRSEKSLNWLIKPNREKVESSTGTIEMDGVQEKPKSVSTAAHPAEVPDFERPKKGTFYHEKIILGYSAEQMCDLVGNVPKYKEFLPFCINSEVDLPSAS